MRSRINRVVQLAPSDAKEFRGVQFRHRRCYHTTEILLVTPRLVEFSEVKAGLPRVADWWGGDRATRPHIVLDKPFTTTRFHRYPAVMGEEEGTKTHGDRYAGMEGFNSTK